MKISRKAAGVVASSVAVIALGAGIAVAATSGGSDPDPVQPVSVETTAATSASTSAVDTRTPSVAADTVSSVASTSATSSAAPAVSHSSVAPSTRIKPKMQVKEQVVSDESTAEETASESNSDASVVPPAPTSTNSVDIFPALPEQNLPSEIPAQQGPVSGGNNFGLPSSTEHGQN